MKGSGAKRDVCPDSSVSSGAKFSFAPAESAPHTSSIPWSDFILIGPLSSHDPAVLAKIRNSVRYSTDVAGGRAVGAVAPTALPPSREP